MTNFTADTWRARLHERAGRFITWLNQPDDASFAVYATTLGLTLWPAVAEVARTGTTATVLPALLTIAGGVGGNLVAEQLQRWRDRRRGEEEEPGEEEVIRWVHEALLSAGALPRSDLQEALDKLVAELEVLPLLETHLAEGEWERLRLIIRQELAVRDHYHVGTVEARAVAIGKNARAIYRQIGYQHVGDVHYNYFFQHPRHTLPQFTTAVENFIANYLGTAQDPVPFGGRDADLARLERWRREGEQPRLLLTAPAGRGKSALLVRWTRQLLAHAGRVAVIFLPISVRFNTNREEITFSLLATQLAHLHGEQIPTDYANFTSAMWRALVAQYLREPLPDGRQLLLILDGLDEAAWDVGADLFPHQLPSNTRLLLSARTLAGESGPAGWLRRLGWDRFPGAVRTTALVRLDKAGVRDVLVTMGAPLDTLGDRVDVVAELYRLSEGDPLLVELYVAELWHRRETAARLQVEDLEKIAPGYRGFFDNWWRDQQQLWGAERPLKEPLVRGLLHLLATAVLATLLVHT